MVKTDPIRNVEKTVLPACRRAGVSLMVLLTDETRQPDPVTAMLNLPFGSVVIFRDYTVADRVQKATALCKHTKACGHIFLVAGDVGLARRVGADGIHMPEHMLMGRRQNLFGFSYITAACHSRRALNQAAALSVDLALVSPVFPTGSHVEKTALGIHRFVRLVNRTALPIAALGGISGKNAGQLKGLRLHAIAGISAITCHGGG